MGNRAKLSRLAGAVAPITRTLQSETKGHSRLLVTVENDPYPEGSMPESGQSCQGCGKAWDGLQAEGFMRPCNRPGESVIIRVEYADDPMIQHMPRPEVLDDPFEAKQPLEALPARSEGIVAEPLTPAQEPLIPSDEILAGLSEPELDAIIQRVSDWKEREHGKG